MTRLLSFLSSESNRAYVYRVAVAVLAAAAAARFITPDEVDVYLNVLLAVTGIGTTSLAVKNTSTDAES